MLLQTTFVPRCVLLQSEVGKKGMVWQVTDGMSPWLQEHLSFTGGDSASSSVGPCKQTFGALQSPFRGMAFHFPRLLKTMLLSGLPDIPDFLGYHSSRIFTAANNKALKGTYLFSYFIQLARLKS